MNMSETVETDLRRVILQTLESWQAAGISHLAAVSLPPSSAPAPTETPSPVVPEATARGVSDTAAPLTAAPPLVSPDVETNLDMARKAVPATTPSLLNQAAAADSLARLPQVPPLSRDQRVVELQILAKKVAQCTRCTELANTRTQTVFGVGNPQARLVFIGEAPGADEDATGEPFVGRAGQLLNKIIEAMKLTREEIYICNILRCRPPGNRLPAPDEAAHCREYLDGQLGIIQPEYIVCWGSCAAQNLLQATETIGKLRGRFFQYGRAKVLCTYHPSYLLRNPAAKKDVWEDMKILMKEMGLPID